MNSSTEYYDLIADSEDISGTYADISFELSGNSLTCTFSGMAMLDNELTDEVLFNIPVSGVVYIEDITIIP
jgi:hypothetical protein